MLLGIAGVFWIGQGLNMLGQSGGMNGQHIWTLISLICVVAAFGLITAGGRAGRAARRLGAFAVSGPARGRGIRGRIGDAEIVDRIDDAATEE